VELSDHNRWIYDAPSIGRDNKPRTGFNDYLATPERIASGVPTTEAAASADSAI
jgi:hypothetical protein